MSEEGKNGFFEASSRFTFIFGLVLGWAVLSTVAFFVILPKATGSNSNKNANVAGDTVQANANQNVNQAPSPLEVSNIKTMAADLNLDTDKFNKCLDGGDKAAKVKSDSADGTKLGVSGTPALFVNGYLVTGAVPYATLKTIVDDLLAGQTPTGVDSTTPADVKIGENDHEKGNKNAKITMVEYADFQCPYCISYAPTIEKLLNDYPDQIRYSYKNFPLSFHPYAQKAAEAFECAADQAKVWEMHDKLFGL